VSIIHYFDNGQIYGEDSLANCMIRSKFQVSLLFVKLLTYEYIKNITQLEKEMEKTNIKNYY